MTLQQVFAGYPSWVPSTVAVALAIILAGVLAEVVARLVRRPLVRLVEHDHVPLRDQITRRPVRIIRAVVFLVLAGVLLSPALQLGGMSADIGLDLSSLGRWLVSSGLRIAIIVLLVWVVARVTALVVARAARDVEARGGAAAAERAKRVRTLGNLVKNTVASVLTGTALLMVLRELGIDIVPLLTGAGIVGLAVGFGAQTLVKDIISGFFLILEDQVRVGDVAQINGTGGLVEAITLRTIVLRDNNGTVHVFPNGSITTLSNSSKDFSYFVLDVGVGYDEDPDRVMTLLKEIGSDLQKDPVVGPSILEPIEIQGIETLGDWAVTVRARLKTVPLRQWDVGRAARRRVVRAFADHGIRIPFPQRTLHMTSLPAMAEPPRSPEQS